MLLPWDRVDLGAMEGVLCISQSSSITGASPSDCLVSYPGHSLGQGILHLYRAVYSAALADCITNASAKEDIEVSKESCWSIKFAWALSRYEA